MSKKIELQELKGLDSLSNRDYQIWRQQQIKAGKLTGKNSFTYERQLYANQQFVKRHGEQAFKALNKQQRDSYEQAALKIHNDNLIRKTVKDWANPFREDGTVDPNKGVGDADTYYKILGMDPMFQKELYESDWKVSRDVEKIIEQKKKSAHEDINERTAFFSSYDPEMAKVTAMEGLARHIVLDDADATKIRGENKNILDKILKKDHDKKAKESQPQVQAEYNKLLNLKDEDMNSLFIETIFPKKGETLGVPQLAAYFNKDGTIKSDEVENMSMDEKRMVVAKNRAYQQVFGSSIAYDIQDSEAKDYISDHQDWADVVQKFSADFAVATAAYSADMMNGCRNLWIRAGEELGNYEEVNAYIDNEGHYWGKEYVKDNIYTDPYTGEQIPVRLTKAKVSDLDSQGIASDGTTRRAIFNNKYWSDAEMTGSFDTDEHAQAKALNGYSANKMVYKEGEDQSYVWEIFKMGSFAAADMALAAAPGGIGLAGKGLKTLGTMGKAANMGRKALKYTGVGLEYTAKAMNEVKPFYASVGMSHMMGRGTLSENLQDNMSAINNLLRSEGENQYLKILGHKSMETGDVFYNREMEAKQADLKSRTEQLFNKRYGEWRSQVMKQNGGKDPETLLSSSELQKIKDEIKEASTREFAESYINDYVEQQKTTDRYKQMVEEAAETASDAAFVLSATTGAQYGFINACGYRRYLYKDPTKRIKTSASKRIRDAFTDPNTGKLTIQSIYDGVTKGQNVKNFAKIAASQMVKEGLEEAGDELHTFGAKQVNADAMSKYLNGEYSANAEARTYGFWEGVNSYFLGAANGMFDEQTYEAARIGSLSGGFNITPNVLSIVSPDFKKRWNRAREENRSPLELINMLVNNGVLNTYYDEVDGEREAKRIVNTVNQIVDKSDNFKVLARGLAMDQAKLGDLSQDEDDALEFMKAAQIINQLQEFSKDEANTLLGAASKRSDVFKTALEQVEKITSGKFTEQDARGMLSEYYTKNPSIPQTEENSMKALEHIKKNAESLKKGAEVINQVNEKIGKYEKKTGNKVHSLVRAELSERLALDQFLEQRIADNEEKISGSRIVNTQRNAAAYGTKEGVKNKISDLDHIIANHTGEVDACKSIVEKKRSELEDYMKSLQGEEELTSDEQKKLAKLTNEVKAAELELKVAESTKNKIESERNSLKAQEENWEDGKIMTKDEILSAHPEDRAMMLSPYNTSGYSKEQQEQIELARQELLLKGEEILNDTVKSQASNIETHSQNKQALSSIIEDPEAALVNMLSKVSQADVVAANDRHVSQVMDAFVTHIENNPNLDPKELDNILYKTLLQNPSISKNILRHKRGKAYTKYAHVIEKVSKVDDMLTNVSYYAQKNDITGAARTELIGTVTDILKRTTDEKEVLEKLGEITQNSQIPEETRGRIKSLLEELEEIYQHKSKATIANEQQIAEAKKAKEAKKKAEEAEKAKREEQIKKEEEQKKKEKEEEEKNKIAEREAAGLSEEDVNVDNESSLTPEQIEEALENAEEIDIESPTADEQVESDQSGTVSKVDIPNKDTSNLDAQVNEKGSDVLLGNMLYRYDKDKANAGILEKRKGRQPNDPMNRRFAWFENEGIKLQEIIDSELHHIVKLGVKIHPLTVNPQKNATDDIVFKDDIIWVVEYTQEVKRIHNEELGGVITANGKQYLIIGQGGYGKSPTEQFDNFNKLRNKQQGKRHRYFSNNPSERFFVDESVHTKVKDISSGYLVRQQDTDTEQKPRPVTELLQGKRNPRGDKVGIEDLKWGIVYNNNEMVTVNVSENQRDKIRALRSNRPGSVYLLVEAADGKLTPAFIRPKFLSEINKGALKDEITALINDLSSLDHNKRVQAVTELSHYINLTNNKDQILVGTPSKPTVTIQKGGANIKTFDLNDPDVKIKMVEFIFEDFNPRINITAPVLKDESRIEKYAEAGALDIDIAQLGTANASYTVYNINDDGNPNIESAESVSNQNIEGSDLFNQAANEVYSTTYHGKNAVKDSNGNWKLNGEPVTDASMLSQLEYHYKLDSKNIKPAMTIEEGDVYVIVDSDSNPLLYVKKGDYIQSRKGDAAKKLLKEIRQQQEEKAQQQRIEEEQRNDEGFNNIEEAGQEDNSNKGDTNNQENEEILSNEDILNQQLGDFESKSEDQSLEEQKIEAKLEKIFEESDKLQLTEDENYYIDTETGELYARVTSIEHADINSDEGDRFDPNAPWGLPSTAIGNGIDEFIRDFFDDTLGDFDTLSERYPNATTESLQQLREQLITLKQQLQNRGIKIVSKGVKAIGSVVVTDKDGNKKSLKVAGTLDLLGYDKQGNFYVFDIKTNRSMPNPDSTFGRKKLHGWSKQTSMYKEFLENRYHLTVKSLEVIPVQVSYPTPVGASDRRGPGSTSYTEVDNQLYANDEEYRDANPKLHPNIPLSEYKVNIQYEKLTPSEQALVQDLASSKKNTTGNKESNQISNPSIQSKDAANANMSLVESQSADDLSTPGGIFCSTEFGDRLFEILQNKESQGWEIPDDISKLNDLLVEKGMPITGITNPKAWLDMLENCRN